MEDTALRARCYPLLYRTSKGAHGAEISIQISALAGVWTSVLSLGNPAHNRCTEVVTEDESLSQSVLDNIK